MPEKYWMITNRNVGTTGFGDSESRLSYGDGIANLTYRVTALYSGKDPILGVSAGLKHFGKRRLGRSGLDTRFEVPDNVWDIDCTQFFEDVLAENVHSAYFDVADTQRVMREVLVGRDRRVLAQAFNLARATA